MTKQLPGNLAEIFPLRLRLRKEFRFFQTGGQVVAERVEDGQRFSVRRWQYEMILRFDGRRTFEEAAREAYQKEGGGFTAVGVLNFYRWLYQEDLVLCECESVFELVVDEDEPQVSHQPSQPVPSVSEVSRPRFSGVREAIDGAVQNKEWKMQALRVTAVVLFSLSVLRLGYVAAPILEPPVNRAFAEVEEYFYEGAPRPTQIESARGIAESPSKEVKLAGRVEPSEVAPPELSPAAPPEPDINLEYIEGLRRRMSECRIRRDEFYIQNNEAGYRQEVEKMTALAREIGEIESKL